MVRRRNLRSRRATGATFEAAMICTTGAATALKIRDFNLPSNRPYQLVSMVVQFSASSPAIVAAACGFPNDGVRTLPIIAVGPGRATRRINCRSLRGTHAEDLQVINVRTLNASVVVVVKLRVLLGPPFSINVGFGEVTEVFSSLSLVGGASQSGSD